MRITKVTVKNFRNLAEEVIEDGRSGVIVDTWREIPAALERADAIDPVECRRYAEELFAPERMVADYENAYRKAIG